ncbi:hypothetical protein GGU11DRAFT_864999 [Lentinula aff. detonsa]|nr:hypothetical protein GGU11DRAFT_864999 [Lentinula aff. detonsa]
MRQQLTTQAGPSWDRSSSLIPAEVPEEPEIAEPIKEVSPDLPDDLEDPDPKGSDPEGPPGGPGGPGGPNSPRSSRGPSRSRSPPARPSSNRSNIAEQQIIELFTTFRGTLNNLGGAIMGISTNRGPTETARSKVKDLEVFGSNPRKLKGFLVSLSLVFIDSPTYFTDQRKINYMLSYLGGAAKEWFEPDILDPNLAEMPTWTSSFASLVKELQDNFEILSTHPSQPKSSTSGWIPDTTTLQTYSFHIITNKPIPPLSFPIVHLLFHSSSVLRPALA